MTSRKQPCFDRRAGVGASALAPCHTRPRAGRPSRGPFPEAPKLAAQHSDARPEDLRRRLRASLDELTPERFRHSRRIKWRLHGPEVLPAWVADMDFPVAPEIAEVIAEALARHDFGYHRLPLDPTLRDVFVERMHGRFGWEVEPRSVWGLVNVVQGLDAAVALFSEPGQGVLLQTPIYSPFHEAVDGSGRRRRDSPLVPGEERYEIDFDHLESQIDAETRVFLLCNPHNPTGRVFSRRELEQLAEIALRRDLIVVSDEIHADLVYEGHRHLPFAGLSPEIAQRTITVTSATKAFNIAGLPTALMVLGSPEIKRRFRELPPHLLAHGGLLGTEAAIAAWTLSEAWLEEVMVYLAENRGALSSFLEERLPQIGMLEPEATYLAWLDCRELALPGGPWRFFLDRARVALSNGEDFGPPGVGCVRLNFATSRGILSEILERMADAVERS